MFNKTDAWSLPADAIQIVKLFNLCEHLLLVIWTYQLLCFKNLTNIVFLDC